MTEHNSSRNASAGRSPSASTVGAELPDELTLQQVLEICASSQSAQLRRDQLTTLRGVLEAHLSAGGDNEFGPLFREIDKAIEQLDGAGGEAGTRSALATDAP